MEPATLFFIKENDSTLSLRLALYVYLAKTYLNF